METFYLCFIQISKSSVFSLYPFSFEEFMDFSIQHSFFFYYLQLKWFLFMSKSQELLILSCFAAYIIIGRHAKFQLQITRYKDAFFCWGKRKKFCPKVRLVISEWKRGKSECRKESYRRLMKKGLLGNEFSVWSSCLRLG